MSRDAGRLAVLGDPLRYTLSPVLHRAGLAALGEPGESEALRTPVETLGERLRELAERGFRGASLTHPLKQAALAHLARASEAAALARSVNTVGFGADGPWGDTTDGPGFVDLLGTLGRDPARSRVVILGGGGAARSLTLALTSVGCTAVVASTRRPEAAGGWIDLAPARVVPWNGDEAGDAIAAASVLVNATPLTRPDRLPPLTSLRRGALVVDLVYEERPTDWVRAARALGIEAYDGLGLLVFQARRALALWTARPVPVDPLARAVGWPR